MTKICITQGTYRQNDVSGVVATLIKPFTKGRSGSYVTVEGEAFGYTGCKSRVMVSSADDYSEVDDDTPIGFPESLSEKAAAAVSKIDWSSVSLEGDTETETELETIQRINSRFEVLDELATGVALGKLRGLVVVGAPGVGKSFGVEIKRLRPVSNAAFSIFNASESKNTASQSSNTRI